MLLSQSAEYAMRSVLHLAQSGGNRYVGVAEISRATGIPGSYLTKVLGQLVRAGVLQSMRGPGGGFRLGRAPAELTLENVLAVFNHAEPRRCLLGTGVCGEQPACAVHRLWSPIATGLQEFFDTTTIADLSRSTSISAGGVL